MQAEDERAIEPQTTSIPSKPEVLAPSEPPGASVVASSSSDPRPISLMEQIRAEKAQAEQAARIREHRITRASAQKGGKDPLWSSNGPREDAMRGATYGYGTYARPFAHVRQCWSDAERDPGYVASLPYGFQCVFVTAVCGPGDVVATTLRMCRLPEAGAFWMGRLTCASLLPISIAVGGTSGAIAGPVVAVLIARRRRDADLNRIQHNCRNKKTADHTVNTMTGTDMSRGIGLPSDMSAGAMTFSS